MVFTCTKNAWLSNTNVTKKNVCPIYSGLLFNNVCVHPSVVCVYIYSLLHFHIHGRKTWELSLIYEVCCRYLGKGADVPSYCYHVQRCWNLTLYILSIYCVRFSLETFRTHRLYISTLIQGSTRLMNEMFRLHFPVQSFSSKVKIYCT